MPRVVGGHHDDTKPSLWKCEPQESQTLSVKDHLVLLEEVQLRRSSQDHPSSWWEPGPCPKPSWQGQALCQPPLVFPSPSLSQWIVCHVGAIKTISISSDGSFLPFLLSARFSSFLDVVKKQTHPSFVVRGHPHLSIPSWAGDVAGPHLHPGT